MALIETKFDIGDVVYRAGTTAETRQHPCPDCLGSKAWSCRSPAGGEYQIPCPRCGGAYMSNQALSLTYSQWAPTVERLTIGSIKANAQRDDAYDSGNTYMCLETGVGSGSVYREADLFATEEEALAAAKVKAAVSNADPAGWAAKQYQGSLKFSDYELRDAAIKAAEDRAWSANYDRNRLVEEITEAESLDEVKAVIARRSDEAEAA